MTKVGGNSNIVFIFKALIWGNDFQVDEHMFSNGLLQPPTRLLCRQKPTAKAPENQWLEDEFVFWDGLCSGIMLVSGTFNGTHFGGWDQ